MRALAIAALFCINAFAVNPFELPQMNHDQAGTLFKSTDHPNGVFVVEAYFLGCPYCHENAPNVDELAEKYANEPRVQVLDVGVDRQDSQYAQWIEKHQPNHPVLKDANRVLIRQLGTTGYPSAYVIDCKGTVLHKTSGVWNSSKKAAIEKAIAQGLQTVCVVTE